MCHIRVLGVAILNYAQWDGRKLNDRLDIYIFFNLIHEATRIGKTFATLLDLVLNNNSWRILITGVVDV